MANEEQLAILRQGVEIWNEWRRDNPDIAIDLSNANLRGEDLAGVDFSQANLIQANLGEVFTSNLNTADNGNAWGSGPTDLSRANLEKADLRLADLNRALLMEANLSNTNLSLANLYGAHLSGSDFGGAGLNDTIFGRSDLSEVIGLENVDHLAPSPISTDTFVFSKGRIPETFLRGCGLGDWEIEAVKLYNPELSNDERNKILYRIYDLQTSQALQISPLFISYSHADAEFVDKVGKNLTQKGIRFWRDIHNMKSGRIEKQIDRAIRQNPTVLLILSEHSLSSDWVEHEVRTGRELEKELSHDVLCPIALDDSWKSSRWPKRIMEQIMEYNILDFSEWEDDAKFDGMFRKLIDGLELFYKG
jgi:uncharacterized protein YjbI with pentapeptide repeats